MTSKSRRTAFSLRAAALALILALCILAPAYAAEEAVVITFSENEIVADAPGLYAEDGVLTITLPGEYRLEGALENGQVVVDCEQDGKVRLILGGVSIHCEDGPALYVKKCSPRLSIELAEGTENALSDGAARSDEGLNGVIYSKSDLTITGSGALAVKAAFRDGIVSKDDLRVKGGKITVEAVRNGIRGKDCVEIFDGELTVIAGNDGIKTTNDDPDWGYILLEGGAVRITCGDDPLKVVHGLSITGGTLDVTIDPSLKASGD